MTFSNRSVNLQYSLQFKKGTCDFRSGNITPCQDMQIDIKEE